ncbi:hypothetical protein OG204_19330 [Streptomyces sp. NBC_01387]|uniref:hypothetical protein n=1 Tax=unclassified Streptomyces TaxID=2593676 RepID=UPI00202420A2|nr:MULTISPECIES: hypothetical protein [unclassified Streptomyces]MCX4549504.1 hypothetical protein [Streptomyces sp. NBC_01500]WSC21040.1 hypothetical protein OIE60_15890 [Streptomyces sp. NBC_01766]
MHMNSDSHLRTEDRPEFERVLDDALRAAPDRPDLAAVGQRLNSEQLRTMVLNADALVTTAAAAEYEHFVKMRAELRAPAAASVRTAVLTPGRGGTGSGAGLTAVVAVLAPVLAGTAAAIFLLVGYLLKALSAPPAFADTMVTAGWAFAALTAAAILFAAIGLLITALRNSSNEVHREAEEENGDDELSEEVARARDAWRHALLERGIVPFLRNALADPSADPAAPAPYRPAGRIPSLGYSRPDFTGPDEGTAAHERPSFTSPDFTSPDFGGPDHQPE